MSDERRTPPLGFRALLAGLEAAGEETRLRILCLLEAAELTVSELVAILGQSQPRVSRHLRLLVEAGLATRQREGAWAFFRLAEPGGDARARMAAPARSGRSDRERRPRPPRHRARGAPEAGGGLFRRPRRRLGPDPRAARARGAGRGGACRHDRRRSPSAICSILAPAPAACSSFSPRARRARSASTRARRCWRWRAPAIDQAGLRHVSLRQGDIYAPPVERDAYDLVVIHQVLHFLDDPARALAEAARALAPGGRLVVVDFDAHDQEFLRDEFAHRRLGFAVDEVEGYLAEAGLAAIRVERVPPAKGEAGKLTVALWIAEDPRVISDDFLKRDTEFA